MIVLAMPMTISTNRLSSGVITAQLTRAEVASLPLGVTSMNRTGGSPNGFKRLENAICGNAKDWNKLVAGVMTGSQVPRLSHNSVCTNTNITRSATGKFSSGGIL